MHALGDMIREIWSVMRQYKARTAMTMFGILWGTMTVVLLLSFGVGVGKALRKNMHGMGEWIVIVWPGSTSIPFEGYGRDRPIRLTHEDLALIRHEVPNIRRISPEYVPWNLPVVRIGEKRKMVTLTGVDPEYGPMRHIWPQPGGRWLNDLDNLHRRRVIFLGNELKTFFFGDEEAVGRYVSVGDIPFLVVGVLKPKTQNSSYYVQDAERAFIPATTYRALFGNKYVNNFLYQLHDPWLSQTTQKAINAVMGKKYRYHPEDTETLHYWDTTEMDRFVSSFSLGFNLFMGLIGTITLIVGGIGLANIMYVIVQERTREIGIRRAVGARRRTILGQFMLEAFLIIGIAALAGFGFALILMRVIALFPIEEYVGHPVLNLPVACVTILLLGAVGFSAGYFPARRAAHLAVVDCLRF